MRLGRLLWSNDISAEYSTADDPKLKRQMNEVLERRIPFMLIVGEKEVEQGVVKMKDMAKRTEEVIFNDPAVLAGFFLRGTSQQLTNSAYCSLGCFFLQFSTAWLMCGRQKPLRDVQRTASAAVTCPFVTFFVVASYACDDHDKDGCYRVFLKLGFESP